MIKPNHAFSRAFSHAFSHTFAAGWSACALSALCSQPAQAAPAAPAAASRMPARAADVISDFRLLARQRPWACPTPTQASGGAAWTDGDARCAWQNRLSRRTWTWSGDDAAAGACISRQARWWARAQADLAPHAPRSVWHSGWSAQSLALAAGAERRLMLVRRDGRGQWTATEWRWNPSPRAATRRWQEGRWKLLTDLAAKSRQPLPAAAPDTARVNAVFGTVLGARAGEAGLDGMAMDAGGMCLRLSNPLPGQPKLPLSYSADDSRLEQRAAMHLQLSRRFPDAAWLTPFKLLATPPDAPGGARFLATWVEGDQLHSQLWMPEKNSPNTLRVRMTTRLAPGQGAHPEGAAVRRAKQAVEREAEAFAAQWARAGVAHTGAAHE